MIFTLIYSGYLLLITSPDKEISLPGRHGRMRITRSHLKESDRLISREDQWRSSMKRKVLTAVDGSPEADTALLKVIEYFNTEEIELHAIYVISPSKYATIEGAAGYEGISTLHEIRDRIIAEEKEAVTERVKNIAHDHGLEISLIVRLGDPRSEILKAADEINADIIAVGSTGKGLGQRILLGSVSTYIVTHSKISTIVIR
ncbi:universal stress protein [Methanospirillum lacunae]|uniref:Universal stress protein n=2 Tax=Methanospirillum lacunae TaxID=668570 RepID=A0A2V2NCS5_9EURY|nr:universal stress protein [Methanospirillum lacunae]